MEMSECHLKYFGGSNQEHKQLIVELDKEFIRDPNKNLVIAVRDKRTVDSPSTKRFELRRHW